MDIYIYYCICLYTLNTMTYFTLTFPILVYHHRIQSDFLPFLFITLSSHSDNPGFHFPHDI